MTTFDRRIIYILIGLICILGAVILAGNLVGLPKPELLPESAEISAAGPIRLVFPEKMDRSSVEKRFWIQPQASGYFKWSIEVESGGEILSFWPEEPFKPGNEISMGIIAGAVGESGISLRTSVQWEATVRQAELLFLSPVDRPEIWRVSGSEQSPVQLTFTDGNVFDYQASPDGETIVYSVRNADNGVDLWEIRRDGSQPVLLLPCAADWCISAVVSPDGEMIAYSRRMSGALPGEGAGVTRLWLYDRLTMNTEALYGNPSIGGTEPVWSPDGRYLAFFDNISLGVRVLDMQSMQDFLLPAQTGMTGRWSPDSNTLLFTSTGETGTGPYIEVFQVDVSTQEIKRVLGENLAPMDYSLPDWSPDGGQVAVALRLMNGEPDKQIVIMDLEGNIIQEVTSDNLYSNASYHWDPSGQYLVFQRLQLDSSDQRPEIFLWDKSSSRQSWIARDAFLPGWLP